MTTGSRILAVLVLLAAAGGSALFLHYRSEANVKPKAAPATRGVPVTVAPVQVKEVPLTLNLVGRAEAWSTVTLRSRVDGQITAVHYQAGQHVGKGQKMVTLDSRALQAQLAQVAANLARDRAHEVGFKTHDISADDGGNSHTDVW